MDKYKIGNTTYEGNLDKYTMIRDYMDLVRNYTFHYNEMTEFKNACIEMENLIEDKWGIHIKDIGSP